MEATTLVLLGRTGNGKSSTGNSILGRNAFTSAWSFRSVTKECKLEQTTLKDGRLLNVVDTPGLFDTNASKEYLQKEIARCIDLAKDGVHGVLYVVSVRSRFTPEEAAVLDNLQMIFGPKIVDYMVVVFTGGDVLENDGMTLQDYLKDCPQKLKEVLQRCNMRMALFDNKTKLETKKEKQRSELLKQIDTVIAENGGQPYSNELFREAQACSQTSVGQQEHAHSGKGYSKEEMEKANAQLLKRLNDMVEEKIQAAKKILEKKVEESVRLAEQRSQEEIRRLWRPHKKSEDNNYGISVPEPGKLKLVLPCPILLVKKIT